MKHVDFPLAAFLIELEAEDPAFRMTVRDYDRIRAALASGGRWNLTRLRHTLGALLVRDMDQKAAFNRIFDAYFDPEHPETGVQADISRILADIDTLKQRAAKPFPFQRPKSARTIQTSRRTTQEREQRTGAFSYFILGTCIVLFAIIALFPDGFILPRLKHWPYEHTGVAQNPIKTPETTDGTQTADAEPETAKINTITVKTPHIGELRRTPIKQDLAWRRYAFAALMFALAAAGYGLYLWVWRKPPDDKPPDVDPSKSRYFRVEKIGGVPAPRLDGPTLAHLGDSTGYFQSETPGKKLDVAASIQATLKSGIPELVFFKHKRIRRVIILKDQFAEALAWNPIADELAAGLERLGVPVLAGVFAGSPAQFYGGRRTCYLEDLEANRRGLMFLMFTDGKGFNAARDRYCLESLARWPMAAWMDLRSPEFRDESAALPAEYGLPVFPATPEGLEAVFKQFMTETGRSAGVSKGIETAGPPLQGNTPLSVWLESALGRALPLAQDCALIQPASFGLIDALRNRFYPDLPPESIEKIAALPGAVRQAGSVRFPRSILVELKRGFIDRRNKTDQKETIDFIVQKLDEAKPVEKGSPEHLHWKAVRERVRMEWYADAYEEMAKLSKTGVGDLVRESLSTVDLTGETGASLVKKPEHRHDKQRLAMMAPKSGVQKAFPISALKWTVLALLVILTAVCAGFGV